MASFADRLAKELIGFECRDYRLVDGGTLILYLQSLPIDARVETRLLIDNAWRIKQGEAIQVGSLDDPQRILASLAMIQACRIERISLEGISGDLSIFMNRGIAIETFSYSTDAEQWELRRADGLRMRIATGLVPFERFEAPD